MHVGKVVKTYREQRRMTQDELSEKSGVSQGYISKLEREKPVNITLETLEALAAALGIDVIDVLRSARAVKPPQPIDTRSLVSILRDAGFSATQIEQVTLYLHALKPEAVPLRWAWEEQAT